MKKNWFFLIHMYTHRAQQQKKPFMKNPKTKMWQQT
jgi:hypothetical protein